MIGEVVKWIKKAHKTPREGEEGGREEDRQVDEGLRTVEKVWKERGKLLRPEAAAAAAAAGKKKEGKRKGMGTGRGRKEVDEDEDQDEEEEEEGEGGRRRGRGKKEYVFSVEDEFESHYHTSSRKGGGRGGGGGEGGAAAAAAVPAGASNSSAPLSTEVMKRIMLEVENLRDHLQDMTDGQIFVCFSEATLLLWKVLIMPSSGTPYYGGCFEFHLSIPPDYPNHPPKCVFMTTGGGQVRYNPNLYHNGKGKLSSSLSLLLFLSLPFFPLLSLIPCCWYWCAKHPSMMNTQRNGIDIFTPNLHTFELTKTLVSTPYL